MFKISSLVVPVAFAISSSVFAQQVSPIHENMKNKSHYNINTYAAYLGLNLEQYGRLHAAITGRIEAVNQGPGFELKKHPSYIQATIINSKNEEIPEVLLAELGDTLNTYNKGMAEYVGISIKKYESISKKFANLSIILNDLQKVSSNLATKPNLSVSDIPTIQGDEDEIEHIEIISTESRITDGGVMLIVAIQSAGIDHMTPGQVSGTFIVHFIAADSDFEGTQTWQVTPTYAWPLDSIKVKEGMPVLD